MLTDCKQKFLTSMEIDVTVASYIIVGVKRYSGMLYMGCFEDHHKRLLTGGKHGTDGDLTPDRCKAKCLQGNYRFFGLESEKECWCGHGWHSDYLRQGISKEKKPESDCNKVW